MWKNILFTCSSKGARKVVLNRVGGGAIALIGIVIIVFIIIAKYPPLLDSIALVQFNVANKLYLSAVVSCFYEQIY